MSRCPNCQSTYEDDSVRVCPHDGTPLARPSPPPPTHRDKVFISYSYNDREWLRRLQINLTPYFRHSEILIWDAEQIEPGSQWFDEINRSLASACVAVLLITPDFLASEFIMEVEVPRLLAAAEAGELQLLWAAVKPSAVAETELRHYQALNNPAEPLTTLPPAEQDLRLVQLCKAIKERARPVVRQETGEGSGPRPLPLLYSFDLRMASLGPCLIDARGRLWVSNAQQTKIFSVGREKPEAAWLLPKVRWKQYLDDIWREQLLVSDWSGSLYAFGPQGGSRERPLYEAGPEDLPMHLLAAGPDGQLVTAAWNGLVRRWDAEGRLHARPAAVVPHLPVHLLPLAGHTLAVVDQSNTLRLFDEAGRETWAWAVGSRVERLWSAAGGARRTFVAQVGARHLLKLREGAKLAEEVELPAPLTCLAHGKEQDGEQWIAAAQLGGRVDWVSASLFGVVRDYSVELGRELKHLLVVHDPQQPASLIALGLTADGQIFTLNEREATFYAAQRPADRLLLDPTGRFLFLFSGSEVSVCRNPVVLPAPCRVELVEPVHGRLVVGGFRSVAVRLRNSGAVAIHQLRAELTATGDIVETSRNSEPPPGPIPPGECVELVFHVRAKVHGDLPLELKVEMADEGGPPFSSGELRFSLESEPAG